MSPVSTDIETAKVAWDVEEMHELCRCRGEFPVDGDLRCRITSSSLSEEVLQFLGMLVHWKRPRHIVQYGGGLSALFLARLQHALGAVEYPAVMSIDHSRRYLNETRRALGTLPGVLLVHAPIAVTEHAGRVFKTYYPEFRRLVQPDLRFDMVVIDGPPAYRYGREAPLYQIAPHLTDDALVVLTDADREPGQEALRNWKARWPSQYVVEMFPEFAKGLALVSIGEALDINDTMVKP